MRGRDGAMAPGGCMRRRRVGATAGAEARLWWTLRATNFTRAKVEHIIATVLRFRGVLTKSEFKQYQRDQAQGDQAQGDQAPRPTASYWYRIREFLKKFGTTPDEPGRIRIASIDDESRSDSAAAVDKGSWASRGCVHRRPCQAIAIARTNADGVPAVRWGRRGGASSSWFQRRTWTCSSPRCTRTAPLASFHGRDRVYSLMAERFVGVSRAAVSDAIRRHEATQITFPQSGAAQLASGTFVKRPNHMWQIDFTFVPYPGMPQKILSIVDCFTGYLWAFGPIAESDYRATARIEDHPKVRIIHELGLREGWPEIIQADNEFSNDALRDLCKRYGTELRISKPHHWKANGVIERFHRSLKTPLKKVETDRGSYRTPLMVLEVVAEHESAAFAQDPRRRVYALRGLRGRKRRQIPAVLDTHLQARRRHEWETQNAPCATKPSYMPPRRRCRRRRQRHRRRRRRRHRPNPNPRGATRPNPNPRGATRDRPNRRRGDGNRAIPTSSSPVTISRYYNDGGEQRQTLIRITRRGVSRTKLHTGKRVYDYKALDAGDEGVWSAEFRVLEERS